MSLRAKLQKSLDEGWCMRFRTNHPKEDTIDGVVTAIRRDFVVLREERDFVFDGVVIMPHRSIIGFRDGKFERRSNEVLLHAGEMRRARSPIWLERCDSLREVLHELEQRDIWPGLEIVWNDEDDGTLSAFYVGPVLDVDDDSFHLHCYDAEGVWEDPYELAIDELFQLSIDDRYTKRFNAWMRAEGPARPL